MYIVVDMLQAAAKAEPRSLLFTAVPERNGGAGLAGGGVSSAGTASTAGARAAISGDDRESEEQSSLLHAEL